MGMILSLSAVFSVFQTDDPEWFFFSPLHKKPQNGGQFKRATNKGFWKSTGPDRKIKHRATGKDIGTKKTLVFHEGRGPSAVSAGWIIHEYHADTRFVRDDVCDPSLTHCFCVNLTSFCFNQHCLVNQKKYIYNQGNCLSC